MTTEILYDSRYGKLTPEVAEIILKSREEVKSLKGRTLKCPICGFRLEEVYEIASGYTIIKWIWRTDNEMAQKRQRFADDRVNQLCYNSYAGNYKLIYYNQCTALLLLGGNTVA